MKLIPKPKPREYPAYGDMYMKWLSDDGLIPEHLKNNFQMVKEFIYQLNRKSTGNIILIP